MRASTIAAMALFTAACGGAPSPVRTALDVSATSLAETDAAVAGYVARTAQDCLDGSESMDGYYECTRTARDLVAALDVTRASLLSLESAADAWDAGGEAEWADLAACAARALMRLGRALAAAGLDAPEEVDTALGLVVGFGGVCRE